MKYKNVTLKVEDANNDKYNLNFNINKTENKLEITCPLCDTTMRKTKPNGLNFACANGHIAFTTLDSEEDIYALLC